MVSRFHDHDDAGDDDTKCPGCLFREALASHLERLAKGDERKWTLCAGKLIVQMHEAVNALQSLRIGEVVGTHLYSDPAECAADSVSAVAALIADLRELLIEE